MSPTPAARPIAIYHEHPDWFRPLFAELERRGTPYVRVDAANHAFDPSETEPPYSLVVNRASPSRKHWVATSLWWLATWRGLMTSVDWPTRPASTARSTRGCITRAYGCGAARRGPRRTVTR